LKISFFNNFHGTHVSVIIKIAFTRDLLKSTSYFKVKCNWIHWKYVDRLNVTIQKSTNYNTTNHTNLISNHTKIISILGHLNAPSWNGQGKWFFHICWQLLLWNIWFSEMVKKIDVSTFVGHFFHEKFGFSEMVKNLVLPYLLGIYFVLNDTIKKFRDTPDKLKSIQLLYGQCLWILVKLLK